MIDERQQELAALHALDLLDGAERSAFETEMARDPALRDLVRELRETTADLALAPPQISPPASLKARILDRLEIPPRLGARDDNVIRPSFFAFSRFLPWAAAAVFAIGCACLAQLYFSARAQNAFLQDQQKLAELELIGARHQAEAERILAQRQVADTTKHLAQLDAQLEQSTHQLATAKRELAETGSRLAASHGESTQLREQIAAAGTQISALQEKLQAQGDLAQFKIATLASLAGNSPQALAVAVWNPTTQQGVLRVEKLPALASDKDYQLWLIDPAYPAPVDGGVFTVDPATGDARIAFKPHHRVANATKFAVSLERKGGVPKVEGPIVLLGD